ncbi:MAG TPA: class I SAM-dependent methyltransferase [Ignavibacteriaceae bacterium]|nr:class I SAM-dependent methyltransferase [Ignavibacteriaceae bacterium]
MNAYNLAAEKYHRLFHDELEKKEFDRQILDEFSNYFGKDSILCDAGCGPSAHIARYLFDKGINIIGIDISEKCIEIAQRVNPLIKFERGDFSKLNFKDNFFDGLISYYSIIDTPKKYIPKIINEFNRVLKPGGYLLLAVKAGSGEGFVNGLLEIETEIYCTFFNEYEILQYALRNELEIIKLEVRKPLEFEIQNDRIYLICKKPLS